MDAHTVFTPPIQHLVAPDSIPRRRPRSYSSHERNSLFDSTFLRHSEDRHRSQSAPASTDRQFQSTSNASVDGSPLGDADSSNERFRTSTCGNGPEDEFVYDSLPPGPWVRILHLIPGHEPSPIRCTLHERLLVDVAGRYDAVSYVWRPDNVSKDTRLIYVDQKQFNVHENLYQFLRHLRSKHKSHCLWIDAICINQNSTEEKNHQVQQMARIYKRCHETIVWLGSGNRYVDALSQWYPLNDRVGTFLSRSSWREEAGQDNLYLDMLLQQPGFVGTSTYLSRIRQGPLGSSTYFVLKKGLESILDNPYWSRLWIVQEIIISRSIRVQVSQAVFTFNDFVFLCADAAEALDSATSGKTTTTFYKKVLFSKMNTLCRERSQKNHQQFHDLIREYGSHNCHDDRDRVFGLLGLAKDISIEVNYSLSRIQLFEMVGRACGPCFADDLAVPLATSLRLESELSQIPLKASCGSILLKLNNVGFIVQEDSGMVWSSRPELDIVIRSYKADEIKQGDTVYSLQSERSGAKPLIRPFMLILRRVARSGENSHSNDLIHYEVAGAAFFAHAYDALPGVSIGQPARGSKAYQHSSTKQVGTVIVEMPTTDLMPLISIRKI